jgi:hypothetical protein
MIVEAQVVHALVGRIFECRVRVDARPLTIDADRYRQSLRRWGPDFDSDALRFLGSRLVAALARDKAPDTRVSVLTDLATFVWLVESVRAGLPAPDFVNSDLSLRVSLDGAVDYQRREHAATAFSKACGARAM